VSPRQVRPAPTTTVAISEEADWYKDAIVYELHVRAYMDSDGDGRGDLRGLTSRLDYLQQLGITAIWLLPFYPSPLRDDGYDIADYTAIHPELGTLADFRHFVREAHRRGIRVITELVLNHTSDQHPWFQRARQAPAASSWRNFYVWSDTPDRYPEARVIFSDFEHSNWTYDSVAGAYYWHRFYSHQPDLNFKHPKVREMMLRTVDFWLGLGVDGLRLDAVPYLFEREGTDCENLPETHEFLVTLRRHVDEAFPGRMLLAEANQWPEDAREYFGNGDECHMAFHFPLMPRLFMGLRMEDRFPIIDIMQQTPDIPESCQWALFLRNHDELTLEMVTDEERDYMYRAYATDPEMRVNLGIRRRLAPLLGYHRQKIELMYGLLFSLPGTPFLYYGDEIGMGDNVFLGDRNGVRTPMQWSGDRNAGFSSTNPHRLFLPVNIDPECNYESVNVAAQLDNPDSLLRWVRRLVALRRRHRVFGRGSIEFVRSENPSVLAFVRRDDNEEVLVVANLSRFSQYVELDLHTFAGRVPLELFGQTPFPPIGDLPYLVTLSPHGFYWFALGHEDAEHHLDEGQLIELRVPDDRAELYEGRTRRALEAALPAMIEPRRWFGGKGRRIHQATITDRFVLGDADLPLDLCVCTIEYLEGESERYLIPMAILRGDDAEHVLRDRPEAVLARTTSPTAGDGIVVDAHYLSEYDHQILDIIARRRRRSGSSATRLAGSPAVGAPRALRSVLEDEDAPVRPGGLEQSNTSAVIGRPETGRVVLKAFRRLAPGINPELEVGRHLIGSGAPVARLLGALELDEDSQTTLVVCHQFVENEGDAWTSTLRIVGAHLEQLVTTDDGTLRSRGELTSSEGPARDTSAALLGEFAPLAELLGSRSAELHVALAESSADGAFGVEPFTALARRSTYQSMRTTARRGLATLRQRAPNLDPEARRLARGVLADEDHAMDVLARVLEITSGTRTRIHGDLHLAQVLSTGRDFVFVDFEGEPARSVSERRLKRSVLVDVAGMLRSFHYVAHAGVTELASRGSIEANDDPELLRRYRDAADRWSAAAGVSFLAGYMPIISRTGLLPDDPEDTARALNAHLLDKAFYELRYELMNRPDWVYLPLLGLTSLLSHEPTGTRS
jgi:maltose alpha-D-glucosyltransferase / alpha-amylase